MVVGQTKRRKEGNINMYIVSYRAEIPVFQ
jgi:hypothetical protein